MPNRHARRGHESGQTLAIFAGGAVAFIIMVGLVIDGGNAFVQQRRTQNAIDAAAEAGAVELARRLVGLPGSDAQWDTRVMNAVTATANVNGVAAVDTVEYTRKDGTILGPVGTGSIPGETQGVAATGTRDFETFFSGVMGFVGFESTADATAIMGYAEETGFGGLIPLTLPIILTQCETGGGSNRLYHPLGNEEWPYGPENMIALPLCSNGPGNVGWIDWDPPAGGAADVAASIRNPDNPPVSTPKWYFVSETGAITSLDDDMDIWEGQDILLPIFHVEADDPGTPTIDESIIGTCDTAPGGTRTLLSDCPAGHNGGTGQNQWYFLVTFGEFHLEHSYIQGNHEPECNDPSLASIASAGTGNQLNNCLIGYFTGPVVAAEMTVGDLTPTSQFTPIAIELIR